jgi:formate dehydrogenase accessory protein FdhE
MPDAWQTRIDRAAALADGDAASLMATVRELLTIQRRCYEILRGRGQRMTGAIDTDAAELLVPAESAFAAASAVVPAALAAERPRDAAEIDTLLRDTWRSASLPFFARLVLQPYAELLAVLAGGAGFREPVYAGRGLETTPGRTGCPFCGGRPQLSILRQESGADGGGRALMCATCMTVWPTRRVLCSNCGEEDERRLGYYQTPELPHLRVDACESCRHYLKTVDLTRLGLAVPIVDEMAGAALDLWAVERGYQKIELNLIGL